jgi:formate dehydrogenase major subunit
VLIQESKVGTCDVQPGRRPTGRALLDYVLDYKQRAGLIGESYPDLVTTGAGPGTGVHGTADQGSGDPTPDPHQEA